MTLNDYVPLKFRRLRPQSRPNEATSLITQLAQKYGLENIGEIDEQFLDGFTCASDIVIAQLEKEFESDNKGEWIDNGNGSYTCSNCKTEWTTSQIEKMCFCPTCGNPKGGALEMAKSALSENKGDLISRQAVLDELEKWDWQELYLPIHFKQILDDVPSVENKGEWIKVQSGDKDFPESIVCSKCRNENSHFDFNEHAEPIGKVFVKSKFCPNCGADMRGSANE